MTPIVTPNILQQLRVAQAPAPALATPTLGLPQMPSLPAVSAPLMSKIPTPPTQTQIDQGRLDYLKDSGSGIDQIHNPLLRGLARTADIAGSVFGTAIPGVRPLMATLPGTTLHHQVLVNQAEQNLANDQANQKAVDASADTESQTHQRESLAGKADALAAADTPVPITPELAEAAGVPQLAGTSLPMRDYQRILANHQTVQGRITTNAATNATRQSVSDDKNDTSTANAETAAGARQSVSDAANKTRLLVAQMHDATSRANNVNTNDHKGTTAGGSFKVPADVTKRAALGANATENANAVDTLLNRNPSIVGAAGGRYTSVQDMIGSNDPDIAELGVRMHNIALASNGAHGIRAAQAIQKTEDELFKNFKRGPDGIHAALNATRDSMQTFLNDEQNYQGTGTRTGTHGSGDPLGIR